MTEIDIAESDDSLMQRAAGGDATAFDIVVWRHQHRVQRFAARMLGGDTARAADIAVGAFLRLWERRESYAGCGRLEAWLLKTAYRQCLDELSSGGPESTVSEEFPATEVCLPRQIEREALHEAVRTAVMELPATHRAVVVLTVYEGLTYEAASETLGIPPGTVASRKNHALGMLRRRLAAWEEPK